MGAPRGLDDLRAPTCSSESASGGAPPSESVDSDSLEPVAVELSDPLSLPVGVLLPSSAGGSSPSAYLEKLIPVLSLGKKNKDSKLVFLIHEFIPLSIFPNWEFLRIN